jgi:hypothetical protein
VSLRTPGGAGRGLRANGLGRETNRVPGRPAWIDKMRLSLFQSVSYHSRPCGGAVAQLGERRVRNAKVEGSIPFRSTIFPRSDRVELFSDELQRTRLGIGRGGD